MPLAGRFSNLKPLGEFFDFKRLSKPSNFGEVQSRASYNLGYFASNYAVVFTMLSVYSLLTNLLLLFVILLVVGGMWGIGRLGGRDLTIGRFSFFPASARSATGDLPPFTCSVVNWIIFRYVDGSCITAVFTNS